MEKYDAIVIGAGSAGISVIYNLNSIGKKILLIEKNKIGGECTWSGCVPSKAILSASKKYKDYSDVKKYIDEARNNIYSHETPNIIGKIVDKLIFGEAVIESEHVVEANDIRYYGENIFVCAGSKLNCPNIKGLDKIQYDTNETIFNWTDLPQSLTIIGGGVIAVEMAQAFNRLGVKINILESMSDILYRYDDDIRNVLVKKLKEEKIQINTSINIENVTKEDDKITVNTDKGSFISDRLLVCTGRKAGFAIRNIEAKTSKNHFLIIDENLRLEGYNNIFIVGDMTGKGLFSHTANEEASRAVSNAYGDDIAMNYNGLSVIYTSPEISSIGYNEKDLNRLGIDYTVYIRDFNSVDRAITEDESGLVKVLVSPDGYILGAQIACVCAGELINELNLIKTLNMKFDTLSAIKHPYPTYSNVFDRLSTDGFKKS